MIYIRRSQNWGTGSEQETKRPWRSLGGADTQEWKGSGEKAWLGALYGHGDFLCAEEDVKGKG